MMDALDALRDLPGTAQTRGETDVIDVESHTMNLPAVRDLEDWERELVHVGGLADTWTGSDLFNRWTWADSLVKATRKPGHPARFKALMVAALAAGFDGEPPVSADEFEVALLEFDVARAGAR